MSEKKKLTLSIDSEVIGKAKKLGLNLSDITEKALRMSSFGIGDEVMATPEVLREAYADTFKKLGKILRKWDMTLKIGEDKELDVPIYYEYILTPNEIELWVSYEHEPSNIWQFDDEKLPILEFYDTEKIITNLIDKLFEKAQNNNEILNKLQLLKNILDLSELSK